MKPWHAEQWVDGSRGTRAGVERSCSTARERRRVTERVEEGDAKVMSELTERDKSLTLFASRCRLYVHEYSPLFRFHLG